MLVVVAFALTANMLVQDLTDPSDGTPRVATLVNLLAAWGVAEYAFSRRWTPLRLWRAFAPVYTFTTIYFLSAILARGSVGSDGHRFEIVVIFSGIVFFVTSIVALARRAQYLGAGRIPFGGRKLSLT